MNFMFPLDTRFNCQLKNKDELRTEYKLEELGWWFDCLAGHEIVTRQATDNDIAKAWLRKDASRKAQDYMIQLHENASLIPKKAFKTIRSIGVHEDVIQKEIAAIKSMLEVG